MLPDRARHDLQVIVVAPLRRAATAGAAAAAGAAAVVCLGWRLKAEREGEREREREIREGAEEEVRFRKEQGLKN